MYFEDRKQAGQILAEKLYQQYRYQDCAVVALSLGGVLVAEQISQRLHTVLTLLLTTEIDIPGEGLVYGSVSQTGQFTENDNLSRFELAEYKSEFHGYFEEQKRVSFQKLNRLIGDGGLIDSAVLRDRNIILVSDGFSDEATLAAVMEYLKPIRVNRIIAASPVVSAQALNRLHISVDQICVLDVKGRYISTNHYYSDNFIPSKEQIFKRINQNILKWK